MKIGSPPAHQIRIQARSWLLKLRTEDLNHQDVAAWLAWLRADARHAAAYDEAAAAWELASQVPMAPAAAAELASDRYDGSTPVRHWRRPRTRAIWAAVGAAAASVLVVIAIMRFPLVAPDPPARQVASALGQRELVLLPDGSKMVLGGLTAVEIRYTKRERQLVLARGQAAFQVDHNEPQPFVVKTQLGAVTAVGTAFDINVRSRSMVLTVTEGVVEVDPFPLEARTPGRSALQPLRVSAGQTLTIGPDGVRVQTDLPLGSGWEKGWLAYRNEPLASVVEDVNRYIETPIRLQDASLSELAYTGTVELSNTGAWVAALPAAFPVEVRRTADELVLLKKMDRRLPERRRRPS